MNSRPIWIAKCDRDTHTERERVCQGGGNRYSTTAHLTVESLFRKTYSGQGYMGRVKSENALVLTTWPSGRKASHRHRDLNDPGTVLLL